MMILTQSAAAARLGVSQALLSYYVHRRVNALPVVERDGQRGIDADDLDRFDPNPRRTQQQAVRERALALLAHGQPLPAVAVACGLSIGPLSVIAARAGGVSALRRQAGTLTMIGVGQLLGVNATTALRWADAGLYRVRRRRAGSHRFTSTTRRDLLAFVRDRRSFVRLDPTQIADPLLREVHQQARQDAGGRWLSTAQLADTLGYTPSSLSRAVRDGRWQGEELRVGSYWYGWVATGADMRALLR